MPLTVSAENAGTIYSTGRATVILGDARDVLAGVETESVDLCVVDPPYGVEWQSNLHAERFDVLNGDGAAETDRDGVREILEHCVRVVGQHRHLYVFGSADVLPTLKTTAPVELVWDKTRPGAGDLSAPWAPAHESISFLVSKHRHGGEAGQQTNVAARLRKGSVLSFTPPTGRKVRHPTEKPVGLLCELIESSSRGGGASGRPLRRIGVHRGRRGAARSPCAADREPRAVRAAVRGAPAPCRGARGAGGGRVTDRAPVSVRGQKGRGMGGHSRGYRGDSVEWYTPPGIFAALGLTFDLDPAAPVGGLPWIPAARFYSVEDDGLSQPWAGRVWLNPPYGPRTGDWMRRLAAHGDGIGLVFARTETAWWHETVRCAHAVCFVAGRLTFVDEQRQPGGWNAGAPSALVAYGQACADAVAAAALGMTFAVRAVDLDGQGSLWQASA